MSVYGEGSGEATVKERNMELFGRILGLVGGAIAAYYTGDPNMIGRGGDTGASLFGMADGEKKVRVKPGDTEDDIIDRSGVGGAAQDWNKGLSGAGRMVGGTGSQGGFFGSKQAVQVNTPAPSQSMPQQPSQQPPGLFDSAYSILGGNAGDYRSNGLWSTGIDVSRKREEWERT